MTMILMPSPTDAHKAELTALLHRLAPQSWPEGLQAGREFYDGWGCPISSDIAQDSSVLSGVKTICLTPRHACREWVGVWFHGGAYIQGSHTSHGGMAAQIARACGLPLFHPLYRLAPEHPFPTAVQDGLGVYEALLTNHKDPEKVLIGGDSAGGGLALAVLVATRDKGIPMPGRVVLISPWVDLTCSGATLTALDGMDPLVTRNACESFASLYLHDADPRHVLASPLWADFHNFPRTLIQVGEREVLLDDSRRLERRMAEHGVDVTLQVWPSQIHVWQLHYRDLSQARDAISQIGHFVRT